MDDNFFSNESYENNNNNYRTKKYSNEINSDSETERENLEIYDSLNEKSNKKVNININNISINNEDSVLQEAFNSLSKIPKINNNNNNNNNIVPNKKEKIEEKENIIFNSYSIDNSPQRIRPTKKNHEDENVNLGVSFSKISEPEKYLKSKGNNLNFNYDENNNQGIITPNTSIYNLSDSITKKSGQDYNNIEITSKDVKLNIINNQNNNKNIFEEDSLCRNYKKNNASIVEYNTNQNEDENKLMLNINCQFSKIKKTEENENDIYKSNNENENKNNNDSHFYSNNNDKNDENNDNENNDNVDLSNIIKEKLTLKKNKRTSDIISKRFEVLKKNKKQLLNTGSSIPLNTISSNIIVKNNINIKDDNIDKTLKNSMNNSIKENSNYIYLCPYCNKETPTIIKLEGIQDDVRNPTIDRITIDCSCGNYELNLIEYINLLEQKNIFSKLSENCYNENHDPIKASIYCSKCNKWFCDQCSIFHKSLLPDHITTPTKIPKFSKCLLHPNDDILFFCSKCKIGICEKCKSDSHIDHFFYDIDEYFTETYQALPFKSFEELNEFIEHCNRISEKGKNSFINYIEDMINKLNELKKNIIDNYNISKKRRITQQKLIRYLFGNFICFSDNYQQIKNMNSINYICPTLFLSNDINFLKAANNYSLYLKKESFIEINPDKRLNKEEINIMFDKYRAMLKEMITNSIDTNNIKTNNYNSNKNYINTMQSESNSVYPTLFKIYNNTGIYYGELNNNKRNGIGKQFNNKDEYEGIWCNGEIIKGKSVYFSDQGNIVYEGEFKDGLENGYGEKYYPNNRVYKGIFINGKIDSKYEIQKKMEIIDK